MGASEQGTNCSLPFLFKCGRILEIEYTKNGLWEILVYFSFWDNYHDGEGQVKNGSWRDRKRLFDKDTKSLETQLYPEHSGNTDQG